MTMTYDTPYVGCMIGTAFQRLTAQLDEALKTRGLDVSAAEYMILRALYSRNGLQQCELVNIVGKDKASVSRSVSSLVKKGYVLSESVSHKCCRAWLTERGIAIEPLIMQVADERHKALSELATREDLDAFIRVLKAVIND